MLIMNLLLFTIFVATTVICVMKIYKRNSILEKRLDDVYSELDDEKQQLTKVIYAVNDLNAGLEQLSNDSSEFADFVMSILEDDTSQDVLLTRKKADKKLN